MNNKQMSNREDPRITELKIPPHSIEAEQSVLGGIMIDNEAWDKIADKLTDKDFYRREHQILFRLMSLLSSQGKPFDWVVISTELKSKNALSKVGGEAYLIELIKNTPTAANIEFYADIVKEKSNLRQLIQISQKNIEYAYNPDGRTSKAILDDAEQQIFAITENNTKGNGYKNITSFLATAIEKIDAVRHSKDGVTGLATGYYDLDETTLGLQPADLIIVAARPSMGKTTFAMNLAENVAIASKRPILVFSMEMPGDSLAIRMISSIGRIDQRSLRSGRLGDADWAKITETLGKLAETKIAIDDSASLSPSDIRSRSRRFLREQGDLALIVIDYLQLMQIPGYRENRTQEIADISRSLKGLAKELNVPIIALSQLNRSLEQRADKRPIMSDLRDSGNIEQDADLIMFIYRDEVYNENSPNKGTAEIIISKQRNGEIGTVRLTFLGKYTCFENYQGTSFASRYS